MIQTQIICPSIFPSTTQSDYCLNNDTSNVMIMNLLITSLFSNRYV